jgi:hypothetical protein
MVTNAGVGALDGLPEGAELLSVIAVSAERCGRSRRLLPGLWERVCGRGRMGSSGMINGRGNASLPKELDGRGTLSVLGGLP